MRSAALSPAARTRTRISPAPGTGSGRSATTIVPSATVAARMPRGRSGASQLGHHRHGAGAFLLGAEGGHIEVGGAGVEDGPHLTGDGVLVADDGDIGRAGRPLLVQHGPVGRQL